MSWLKLFLPMVLVGILASEVCCQTELPRYEVDLDRPAEVRWQSICLRFRHGDVDYASYLKKLIHTVVSPNVLDLAEKVALYVDSVFEKPYPAEMKGVATALNLSLTEVIVLNILYELIAAKRACTSIICQDAEGNIYHGRNLDFNMPEFLHNVSFVVDFKKRGKVAYTGVTFVSYVGILTGQKPGAFTVSLDERDEGFIWENIFQLLLTKAKPVGFFVRSLLNDESADFESAIKQIQTVDLIAPEYIIVGGVSKGQGAVITRGRVKAVDTWRLNVTEGRWFLVETNYDHWNAPPPSDDRRDPAIKAMNKVGQGNINMQTLFGVMSTKPVMNNNTVFTTLMSAKHPDVFKAYKRKCCD